MIPVAERFGQWRFAGSATDLGAALGLLDAFCWALRPDADRLPPLEALTSLVEAPAMGFPGEEFAEMWSDPAAERDLAGDHTVLAVGGAPYDDMGIAILDVGQLDGHPYAARPAESLPPRSWSSSAAADLDADLDASPDKWLP